MHLRRVRSSVGRNLTDAVGIAVAAAGAGGGDRQLTIDRDAHINTAKNPNGVLLSVDVVAVTPKDLSGEALENNQDLLPGSHITSADWFAKKPTAKSMGDKNDKEHYRIPYGQIFCYTDDPNPYGKKVDRSLLGTVYNDKPTPVLKIPKPGDIHDKNSLIYVFGEFIDERGKVLPVPPAVFHRTGAYREDIAVQIGGQEIRRVSQRHMHEDDATISDNK